MSSKIITRDEKNAYIYITKHRIVILIFLFSEEFTVKIFEQRIDEKKVALPHDPQKEDFSHIKGDAEDFIFSFSDNKKHSEK